MIVIPKAIGRYIIYSKDESPKYYDIDPETVCSYYKEITGDLEKNLDRFYIPFHRYIHNTIVPYLVIPPEICRFIVFHFSDRPPAITMLVVVKSEMLPVAIFHLDLKGIPQSYISLMDEDTPKTTLH